MTDWIAAHRLAVTAGAGAGKTSMLVDRYLHHVIEQGLSPLEIVAVTFTEAAASELKSRVRRKMEAMLGEDDDRLADLEAARICTLHSLAATTCRQHPTAAGVPADFRILADVLGPLWKLERIDEALDLQPPSRFRRLGYSKIRVLVRDLMQDPISVEAAFSKKPRHWRQAIQKLKDAAAAKLLADPDWQENYDFLNSVNGKLGDLLEESRRMVVSGMNSFKIDPSMQYDLGVIGDAKTNCGSRNNWTVDVNSVKEAIKTVKELAAEALKGGLIGTTFGPADAAMIRQTADLKKVYRSVKEYVETAKQKDRVLDYNDLEVHALRALASSHVQSYYHRRWHAFLIDEYQDTNRVQMQMIDYLLRGGAHQVIVGDENQSIYGFRRAEPAFFRAQQENIVANGGQHERLPSNYRTHSLLLKSINSVFSSSFSSTNGRYENQRAEREHPLAGSRFLRRICVSLAQNIGPKPNRAAQQRVEAIQIARLLLDMVNSNTIVHDRKTSDYRPVQWGDIAILTSKWGPLDSIAEALASCGIPHVHAGGGSLMETREARDGYALIRFLAQPTDSIGLAAVLKSPFCSLSDKDLYDLSLTVAPNWWEGLQLLQQHDQFATACSFLNALLKLRASSTSSRLLHFADCESGLSAVLANLPSGSRRLADWIGFCDLVKTLEQETVDIFGMWRSLRRLETRGPDGELLITVARPALEAGNAINLMSIHRAKGLEWPVVVLADMCAPPKSEAESLYYDPDIGIATKLQDVDSQPLLFTCLKEIKKDRDMHERGRMAYVAATRARDFLIMTSTAPEKRRDNLHGVVEDALNDVGIVVEDWVYNPSDSIPPVPLPSAAQRTTPRLALGPIAVPVTALSVTSLNTYTVCPKRFKYQFIDGHPGIGEGSSIYGRVGTLVHLAIQHAIYNIDDLGRFDRTLEMKHLNSAMTMANNFRNADVFLPYRSDEGCHEVSVSHKLHGIVLTGRIDLLGPNYIVDFKTGRMDDGDRYKIQLWIYGLITGVPDLAVAYLNESKVRSFTSHDMECIPDLVDRILAGIRENKFPAFPSIDVCAACRHNKICAESAV